MKELAEFLIRKLADNPEQALVEESDAAGTVTFKLVVADEDKGKIAARLFDLFEQGWELPAIVMETGESPTVVRAMFEEYRTPLRRKNSALGGAPGDPSDAANLTDAVKELQRALDARGG